MAQAQEQTHFQSLAADKVAAAAFQAASEDLIKEENPPVFAANDLVDSDTHASLSLKLKIPRPDVIEDLQRQPLSDVLRTCDECGKQFTSGKALGGHKRACLQKKNIQKQKVKNVVSVKLDGDQTSAGLHMCYVCHQNFRSLKSLYGHMRKHPDREWRGIQPPPQHENQCISSTVSDYDDQDHGEDVYHRGDEDLGGDYCSDNSAVDLVETLKGWSVKAKRGQRLSEAEAMQQAVHDLMLLAQFRTKDRTVTSKKRGFDQVSSVGSGYGLLKLKEKRAETEDLGKKIQVEGGFDYEETKNMSNSEDTWILKDYEDESEMEIIDEMKQQKKKRRLNELDDMDGVKEEPITTIQTYSCPLCNKAFDKHQALGGHVASHNKNKSIMNTVKESSAASPSASTADDRNSNIDSKATEKDKQLEETGDSSRVAAAAGTEHQCNICNKSFPTGQALGGHKRCHWTGPAEAFSSSSQVTTSAGEVTQRAPRVVLDFDLNDRPPEYYQFHGVEATAAAS